MTLVILIASGLIWSAPLPEPPLHPTGEVRPAALEGKGGSTGEVTRPVPQPLVPLPSKPAPPFILMFTMRECTPCQECKSEFPSLTDVGWTFSTTPEPRSSLPTHVIVVDIETYPELMEKYKVSSLPTFIKIEDGKEVRRQTGFQREKRIGATLERVWGK